MDLAASNSLTQLAFAVHENKGVFALLLGSGLSRAAGIPTGWDITLDLIRRVASAEDIPDQPDWAEWYRATTGKEPNYSDLVAQLGLCPGERRAILHAYIEPSAEDVEVGRKVPTAAHHAIADLVQGGHVRVLITTNFDRLMENALRRRGVEPTVVASVDALAGAEPLTHSACYILKLHGDYKDARILNTEQELGAYPPPYMALLDRIFDEHGLIICGWSGEWDNALRDAFLRTPNRRYSVFWAARDKLGSRAEELVHQRRARVIAISDADAFFPALQQRVETLERSRKQNPLTVDLLVNSAKRFITEPKFRIQLDDLFDEETERVLARLDQIGPPTTWDADTFRSYVERYESATEPLARMSGVLSRWGDGEHLAIFLNIIRTLYAHAERTAGFRRYRDLRSYPAVLVLTAYGLGLTHAELWSDLHQLLEAPIDRWGEEPGRAGEVLFLQAWKAGEAEEWQQIEGMEDYKTPLSEHLFGIFSRWRNSFAPLTPNFELLFDRYEILGSLAYFEKEDKSTIKATLSAVTGGPVGMPLGCVISHSRNRNKLTAEMAREPMKSDLIRAGFGRGDPEIIDLYIKNLDRFAARSW